VDKKKLKVGSENIVLKMEKLIEYVDTEGRDNHWGEGI
jgi:hypothetical protein